MSRSRGFIDCPDSGRGVRTEVIDDQVGAIFRRVRLPEDWQEELAEMVDEDPDLETLKNRRARLVAQRRRLKNALADGVFNKDKDIYDTRMDRIERQLSKLPAEANLEAMGHAADVIEEIAEIWDDATKEERRDLLRLAVEAVKADVPQGRLVTIEPYPVFVPLLRKVPFLRETAFGVFRPIWPQDIVEELEVMDTLDPLGKVPRKETPDWPLVMTLPKDIAGARITPLLSDWLKDRRKADEPLGPVVALENPDAPPLRVDTRYWDTTIERVEDLSEVESNSAAFLWSSFALQRREDKRGLIIEAQRVVEGDGLWVWVDVLPSSMAGHWLYQYFPGAWENDQGLTWNAFDLYNTLVKAGFETEMKRQSIYQPVTLGAARAMVQKRDRCPQLAILPDVVYEEGMERLEAAIEEKGEAHQVSSEICLVVVQATG
jgi:hypothetical protein